MFAPHVGIIRNKFAVLHGADDGVTASANSHRTVRRDLRAAERKRGQRHEIRKAEYHVKKRHRLGHLLSVRRSGAMGMLTTLVPLA